MITRTSHQTARTDSGPDTVRRMRMIAHGSAVNLVVLRVAGDVPVRLDLTHAGLPEQMLGMSLGTALIYLRTGTTARSVAESWGRAAGLARSLSPAVTGRRRLLLGPSVVSVMVQLAGIPRVTGAYEAGREEGAVPEMLRVQVGPVVWEVCDATAYASMLRAWRQAARLLGDNPLENE